MKRIILTFFFATWLLYIGVMYKSQPLILLSMTTFIFEIITMMELLYRFTKIKVTIDCPLNVTDINKPITLHLKIKNSSTLGLCKIRYDIVVQNEFLNIAKTAKIYGDLIRPDDNEFTFSMLLQEPGNYSVILKRVRIYNFLGIHYFTKRLNSVSMIQILPRIEVTNIVSGDATRHFVGESELYDDIFPGNDPSETFGIREFQPGDRLQRVHWKLSARLDDLVVRENGNPKSAAVVYFLDYKIPQKKREDTVEAFLGIASSISFSMLDNECNHFVSWYSGIEKDIVRILVHDEETFYYMISSYLADNHKEKYESNLADLYKERYRGEQYLHELILDQHLVLRKNEETINSFSNKNWMKELEELEIVI